MRELETNLLDWQKRYGTEEACAQALTQQRWSEKGSVARAAGMIMVMSSAHATPTSAPSVITKPRLRREHCFTPPICR